MNTSAIHLATAEPAISVQLAGGAGAPLRARRSVLSQLGGRLTATKTADLALIVSELVTNSVLHANVSAEQTMTVDCAVLPDRLRITVTDSGSALEPHRRSPDHHGAGGYGLMIVEKLCSAWGVVHRRAGTTSVWCELPLDAPPRWSPRAGGASRAPSRGGRAA